jgi:hypothetical protein
VVARPREGIAAARIAGLAACNAPPRETERFKALGAAGIIVKPLVPMTLAATIKGF